MLSRLRTHTHQLKPLSSFNSKRLKEESRDENELKTTTTSAEEPQKAQHQVVVSRRARAVAEQLRAKHRNRAKKSILLNRTAAAEDRRSVASLFMRSTLKRRDKRHDDVLRDARHRTDVDE